MGVNEGRSGVAAIHPTSIASCNGVTGRKEGLGSSNVLVLRELRVRLALAHFWRPFSPYPPGDGGVKTGAFDGVLS